MKICLTINSSPWSRFKGGGQIAVHHLATALAGLGHQVWVLYSKCPGEHLAPKVNYRIHWVRHFNAATLNLNIFSYAAALRRLANRERFDIVHGNAEEACFADWAARRFRPVLFFTSHAPHLPETGLLGGLRRPVHLLKNLNFYLLRRAAARAARVVTFSRFSRSLVVSGLGPAWEDRVDVIAPGVESSWFDVEGTPAKGPPRLIFWGRIEEEKGIPELLRAFQNIPGLYPGARLTLVGEGNRLEDYRHLATDLGLKNDVIFTGWLGMEAIRKLAAESRLGVFPSRIESFGLAVAEAQAAGLPVVATRAGALPEIIEDGKTGSLVPPRDPASLAAALKWVLENPDRAAEWAQNGREVIRKKCSWPRTAEHLTELYEKALNE